MEISWANIQPAVMVTDVNDEVALETPHWTLDHTLVFMDLEPGAAWPHPCIYILVTQGLQTVQTQWGWPPNKTFDLKPVSKAHRWFTRPKEEKP
jgi:hypothetical protein